MNVNRQHKQNQVAKIHYWFWFAQSKPKSFLWLVVTYANIDCDFHKIKLPKILSSIGGAYLQGGALGLPSIGPHWRKTILRGDINSRMSKIIKLERFILEEADENLKNY